MANAFGRKAAGLRLERMKASARYSDGGFRNTFGVSSGLKKGTTFSTLTEYVRGGQRRTPPAPLPAQDPLPTWAAAVETGFRTTWLGHSTVLLEIDGAKVLTDPVWGPRASPYTFAGPKRFQPVPVQISALPKLDAVIISHDHYDHLDYPTILELAKTDVPFVTSLGVGAYLEAWGIPPERITELDWWESVQLRTADIRITAAPSQHFSGRGVGDRNTTLWSSFVIEGRDHSVFFSGDTGLTTEYEEIAKRFRKFNLVMLEIGAWHEAWGDIHLGPANALKALKYLGGARLLPVHWGTFNLAIHAWDEPAETLVRLASEQQVELLMPRLGAAVEPARVAFGVETWWRAVGSTAAAQPRHESAVVAK